MLMVAGDLDVESTPALRWALLEAFNTGVHGVTVDLAGLRFCDSVGLSALIFGYRQAGRRGADFTVVNAREGVATILEVTGLTDVLTVGDSTPAPLPD